MRVPPTNSSPACWWRLPGEGHRRGVHDIHPRPVPPAPSPPIGPLATNRAPLAGRRSGWAVFCCVCFFWRPNGLHPSTVELPHCEPQSQSPLSNPPFPRTHQPTAHCSQSAVAGFHRASRAERRGLSHNNNNRLPTTSTTAAMAEGERAAAAAEAEAAAALDPMLCQKRCARQACDIQYCLQRANYQEARCRSVIAAFDSCCEKAKAAARGRAPAATPRD